jgi:3alpha(or 20beta)-hydroxysteroid dehydrogenase
VRDERRDQESHDEEDMMGRLDGKVMLVTGAARGLGEAIARLGVAQGASVTLADVRDDDGERVAKEIGERAAYVHLDVRDEDQWATAVEETQTRFGHLDVLVNNAAILLAGALETFSLEDFETVVAVNQTGPFLGMRAVVPAMRAAGRGSIINVSSTDGYHGMGGTIGYGASKWALRGMSKIAAQELGPENIRVNAIFPGGLRTEMSKDVKVPGVELNAEQVQKRWALNRFAELDEVAGVALFLASEEATYTTGAEITCDGGSTIGPRYV